MRIRFTVHARQRMVRYEIAEGLVRETLDAPDALVEGHSGRKIAHRTLNGYVLRVVYEQAEDEVVVVTVYRARRDRGAGSIRSRETPKRTRGTAPTAGSGGTL